MNDTTSIPPEVVASFRYTVIAPLVVRPLEFGEQRAIVVEQAAKRWQWPDGSERSVHERTILRWIADYRAGGLSALQPQPHLHHPLRRVSETVLERALALRTEDPHRSARTIIQMLEWAGEIEPNSLAHSTLTYHLRRLHAAAYKAAPPSDTFRRRQAPYALAEVQGDTQLTLWLPDPHRTGRRKKVYLIAFIDDATRYLIGSRFFFDENRPRLEEVLKWAIVCHGIPKSYTWTTAVFIRLTTSSASALNSALTCAIVLCTDPYSPANPEFDALASCC